MSAITQTFSQQPMPINKLNLEARLEEFNGHMFRFIFLQDFQGVIPDLMEYIGTQYISGNYGDFEMFLTQKGKDLLKTAVTPTPELETTQVLRILALRVLK